MVRSLLALLASSPLLAALPTGNGVVVSVAPTDDLQAVVDAAASGTTLVLSPGEHIPPIVTAKSLTIVGDGAVTFASTLEGCQVNDLTADQVFVLRGVDWVVGSGGGFDVVNCAGEVWLEDCWPDGGFQGNAVRAGTSASVTMRGCTLPPSTGFNQSRTPGLLLYDSSAQMYDCYTYGATYSPSAFYCGSVPGASLEAGSKLFAQDSTFKGGSCMFHADASSGVSLYGGSHADLRGCSLVSGTGTQGYVAPEVEANDTSTYVNWGASVERSLELASPLRVGQTYQATFAGGPNELALVFTSASPAATLVEAHQSLVSLGIPVYFVAAVPLDALGAGTLSVTPTLPPGIETSTTFVQAVHVSATGIRAGSPTAVTVIPANL